MGWVEESQKENTLTIIFYLLVAVFVLAISIIFIPAFRGIVSGTFMWYFYDNFRSYSGYIG
jgi:hypothetical protein